MSKHTRSTLNTTTNQPIANQPAQESDDQPPPAISVELIDTSELLSTSQLAQLKTNLNKAFAQLSNSGQVAIRIVDDTDMAKAHQQFSGISGTTDVLTFDYATDSTKPFNQKILDVDLTICFDEAKRQADLHKESIINELLLYSIHGVLHCLGYDDHCDEEYKEMHTKEDQILTAIGIGPLFFRANNPTQTKETNQ